VSYLITSGPIKHNWVDRHGTQGQEQRALGIGDSRFIESNGTRTLLNKIDHHQSVPLFRKMSFEHSGSVKWDECKDSRAGGSEHPKRIPLIDKISIGAEYKHLNM